MALTAVSLFAGVGGFDLALERAGVKVIASVEIDKKASSILARHFPNSKLFSDVKEVTGEQLISAGFIPERGIITGGFPCQDVSVAGKRAGLTGVRTGLFWEIIRLLKETQAQYFILENVPGLLSSNEGRDMGTVLGALAECGYGVAYRILDSQYFGVPQRRRRVFIVGSLGDSGRTPSEILALVEGRAGYLETSQQERKTTSPKIAGGADPFIKIIRSGARAEDGSLPAEVWAERDIAPTLSAFDNGGESRATVLIIDGTRVNDVRVYEDGIVPTVVARYGTGGGNVPMIFEPKSAFEENWAESYVKNTLRANASKSSHVVVDATVRRLTPTECERLQGFPDTEKYAIFEVCFDLQKNPVSVAILNPKLPLLAGSAEKSELVENAGCVESQFLPNYQSIKKPARTDVHINCGANALEIHNQGKLLWSANNVENQNRSALHIEIESFARLVAPMMQTLEKITRTGKVASQENETNSIRVSVGKKQENLSGKEIMPLANFVSSDLIVQQNLTTSTTSSLLDLRNLEQNLLTSFCSVWSAIDGFIPLKISGSDTLIFSVNFKSGWTAFDVDGKLQADSNRYKQMGNAVAVPVVEWIVNRLVDLDEH
jgi:DNA-cytosine methyltransferase